MAMRGPRQPIGSASWIAEERSSALQIAQSEVEEFSFSARNDVDWLNEHMAEIFSENQINVADIFKTPGKLRGKTPRTARKANAAEVRVPLSSLFSSTPKGTPNPFAIPHIDRNQTPKLKIAEDRLLPANPIRASPQKHVASPVVAAPKTTIPPADSGYHGSQTQDAMEIDELADDVVEQIPIDTMAQDKEEQIPQDELRQPLPEPMEQESPTQPTRTFHSAKEEQTMTAKVFSPMPARKPVPSPVSRYSPSPIRMAPSTSPKKSSPLKPSSPVKSSPTKSVAPSSPRKAPAEEEMDVDAEDDEAQDDDVRSPSDGSSPIRGVLRKSSLNFASLPAREPLTSNKSLGARMSRTSHLDQNRQSYYNRHTHGKSLGVARAEAVDDDEMDVDDDPTTTQKPISQPAVNAAKTYTQRLQDRISMLGKSQATDLRMSKPIASLAASQPAAIAPAQPAQQVQPLEKTEKMPSPSPRKPQQSLAAPGAFPEEDDEDDWIAPPASQKETASSSIRPAPLPKSHSTDVMEGLHGKETISESDFVLPKQRQPETLPGSPARIPTKPAGGFGHAKSASVPALPQYIDDEHDSDTVSLKKTISVSNPTLGTVPETDGPATPSKSPSRVFRDSPLKQVKNKLSSILKSSKGLLASSAAISAEGKSSLLSPTGKFGSFAGPSVESLVPSTTPAGEPMYPDLSRAQAPVSPSRPASPARTINRKTRASAEREKREQKQKDKESREAQKLAEQMEKLEKVREKEREKARIFSKEQEKVAAMEKQLAAQKEADAVSQPAPPPPAKDAPKPTRTSPRKAKPQAEFEGKTPAPPEKKRHNADADMTDAQAAMPPPTVPRSAAPTPANRSIKRPIRPTTQSASKGKQAPTVIRVNTTSSQQSQFHPTNSVLSATLQDTLGSQPQLKSKASSASLHNKPSLQSLKSSTTSNGRPKALELAAKRKEQEEREAQRKRDAKAEMERKRAALQEEERRQEEQRRQEAQRQRERDQAEMKKSVKRQDIEKAKQTRAPPPAPRNQPNGPPDYNAARSESGPSRPASRLDSTMHRTQEDSGRPVNAVLSNASKAPVKRPLTQEGNEEGARPCFARNGPSFQTKETKRIRMSEEFDEDELEMGGQPSQSHLKGPPVRPSAGVNKGYMPNKSIFPSGYGNAPQSTGATRDLFKATVTSHHTNQPKAARPLDMAQVSKSTIPFAPNSNAAAHAHKTPARPAGAQLGAKSAAKSATRSSPRMPNGDAIELPEIQTDDDDSDDDGHVGVAPWADSPDLRRALMRQETVDPMQIFGPPAPLNMEEVFSKSKDRFHKFRARTSSANWSGVDRLTEDDIRKDLAARDKMRRDGGWTYELSKDVM